jgi:hypothetical protein
MSSASEVYPRRFAAPRVGLGGCLAALLIGFFLASASANVVRPAPDFAWTNAAGQPQSFNQFRGQPVVLLIAPSPRSWAFRRQVGHLQRVYQRLAATGAICAAAFTAETGLIRSNIPFVLATDGPRVAFLFGTAPGFHVAVMGKDGNIDLLTSRVQSGQQILDIIGNSYAVQQSLRRP